MDQTGQMSHVDLPLGFFKSLAECGDLYVPTGEIARAFKHLRVRFELGALHIWFEGLLFRDLLRLNARMREIRSHISK